MSKEKNSRPLQETEYVALAEFRYQLRRFLRHMEEEVRHLGVNPQQYQLVLAIKGLPKAQVPTISCLAERMQLNHNSMVELVDRCEERSMIRRQRSSTDRRQVTLAITAEGEALLRSLGSAARQELRNIGPMLVDSVLRLTDGKGLRTSESRLRKVAIRKAGS
ncbi:MAG: MarR family winged helix-turn-helix transcriptional regulator [Actinomycetota bacterium]